MGLRINTNVEAFNAHRNLQGTSNRLSKSMEKLSSGFRINRAADDAAGLGISERMRGQIRGIAQAQRNAQDGISLVQTAEGAMQEMHSILHRIRELAVQYQNGVYGTASQAAITAEVAQLSAEIDRMIGAASFNGVALLTGAGTIQLQVGANQGETLTVTLANVGNSITTNGAALTSFISGTPNLSDLDAVIDALAMDRANFGAIQNRLEHTVNALGIYQENLMSAESRIRDVDMAAEMTNFTKLQILQQSGTAMLAQANLSSQGVLSLLQ
jgi:flagellin